MGLLKAVVILDSVWEMPLSRTILFPTYQNSLGLMGWRSSSRDRNMYPCHRIMPSLSLSLLSSLVRIGSVCLFGCGIVVSDSRSDENRGQIESECLPNRAAVSGFISLGTHLGR